MLVPVCAFCLFPAAPFSLSQESCESAADPCNKQKPPNLREIGVIPMSSLVHCGIAASIVKIGALEA